MVQALFSMVIPIIYQPLKDKNYDTRKSKQQTLWKFS